MLSKKILRSTRSDLDFLSCSMKFQQKSKKFEILIDFNRNLILFQTKATNFHNELFPNHASKKYETIFCKEIIPSTFERWEFFLLGAYKTGRSSHFFNLTLNFF